MIRKNETMGLFQRHSFNAYTITQLIYILIMLKIFVYSDLLRLLIKYILESPNFLLCEILYCILKLLSENQNPQS